MSEDKTIKVLQALGGSADIKDYKRKSLRKCILIHATMANNS